MGQSKWVIDWDDDLRYPSLLKDSVWDISTYYIVSFSTDGFSVTKRIAYIGTYLFGPKMGSISTFDLDGKPVHPAKGIKVYFDPYYTRDISFQSALPYYMQRFRVGVFRGFYISGYVMDPPSLKDILMVRTNSLLVPVRAYRYNLDPTGESDEVIYRLFKDGKSFVSNFINFHIVGVGYTTYNVGRSELSGKNILVFGVDSVLRPSFACIYGGSGTDVGTYLYKIDDTTYMVLGYSDSYISSGKYGVFVAKVNTRKCSPYWIRIYYDTLYNISLIPYAINRNVILPLEGGQALTLFHITGTAIDMSGNPDPKYTLFLLTIDDNGSFVNFNRYYFKGGDVGDSSQKRNLLGFESIVDGEDIIVVGETYASFLFSDQLPRLEFIGEPLTVHHGKGFAMRLRTDGSIFWSKVYSSHFEEIDPEGAESGLFAVDRLTDSLFVAGGMVAASDSLTLSYFGASIDVFDGSSTCYDSIHIFRTTYHLTYRKDTFYVGFYPPRYDTVNMKDSLVRAAGYYCIGEPLPFSGVRGGPQAYAVGCGGKGKYEVYTVDGRLVRKGEGMEDFKDLPKGVYMVKRGDRVYKIIRR